MRQCKLYFRNSFQNRTLDQPLPVLHQGFGGTPSYPDVHTPVYPVRDPDTLFGAHGRRRRVRHRMRSTAHRGKASGTAICDGYHSRTTLPRLLQYPRQPQGHRG